MATATSSTVRYPDDYLERWGEFFVHNRLDRVLGITFEQFLAHPGVYVARYHEHMNSEEHLQAAALRISQGQYEPPIVQQAKIRERIYARSLEEALARVKSGMATVDDAEFLQRAIRAARGIEHLPRQDNGHPVEKMGHHRHPKSQADFTRREAKP